MHRSPIRINGPLTFRRTFGLLQRVSPADVAEPANTTERLILASGQAMIAHKMPRPLREIENTEPGD